MEIINTYSETLSHYIMKVSHAEEELEDAGRGLEELSLLAEEGWRGPAGGQAQEKIRELDRQAGSLRSDMEEICGALRQLGAAVEEEIRQLKEQAAAAAQEYPSNV